jgi:hypothetical protein
MRASLCKLLPRHPTEARWLLKAARDILVLIAAMGLLTLPAGRAAAQPAVTESHVPFHFSLLNPCTSELFTGSGFFHLKTTFQTAPNTHVSVELNLESAQGVTESGVRYVVTEQSNSEMVFDTDSAPASQTFEFIEHFVRQKEDVAGDDFYLRFKSHVTVNANGTTTVTFSDFTMDCR